MDKLELLLDMTEHPDRYTEDEIKELLADEDMRKLYQMMVRLREGLTPLQTSPEEELSTPSLRTSSKVEVRRWLLKYAAAFVGAVIMVGLLYAAMRPFFNIPNEETPTASVTTPFPFREGQGDGSAIRFDNVPLDSILAVVSRHYGKIVQFRSEEARTMRLIMTWHPTDSLGEFIGRLNMFEGLHLTLQADTLIVETRPTSDLEGGE